MYFKLNILSRFTDLSEYHIGYKIMTTVSKCSILMILHFIQGLPFGLQEKYLPVYYRSKGMDYTKLMLLKLMYLPWLSKLLWSPLVDQMKNKIKCIFVTTAILMFLYFLAGTHIKSEDYVRVAAFMIITNFVIAFQDVTVDSLAINSLGIEELGYGNTAQVVGYKLGMIVGSGSLAIISEHWELQGVFIVIGLLNFAVLLVLLGTGVSDEGTQVVTVAPKADNLGVRCKEADGLHKRIPNWKEPALSGVDPMLGTLYRDTDKERPPSLPIEKKYSYIQLLHTPGTKRMILFVLIYKLGEYGVLTQFPLFLLDAGVSESLVLFWNGTVAQAASIFGSLLGGYLVSHNMYSVIPSIFIVCFMRIFLIISIGLMVWYTNEPLTDGLYDSQWIALSILLLVTLSVVSGMITTLTFTLMMVSSQSIPEGMRAFHYSFLATGEVLGKLAFMTLMGPTIDTYGEDAAFLAYAILGLLILPIIVF